MSYSTNLKRPCGNCPFLVEGGIRVYTERMDEILDDHATFACHATVDYGSEDDEGNITKHAGEQECVGRMIYKGQATGEHDDQMTRISRRLGLLDTEKLEGHDLVFKTRDALLASCLDAEDQKEIETCAIVWDNGCEAPAGFMRGGRVVDGRVAAEFHCRMCCEAVCENCSQEDDGDDDRLCLQCAEEEGHV